MKMSKAKYVDFYSSLTGHSKSFVSKNLTENKGNHTYTFKVGFQKYNAWIIANRIYCQHFLENVCQNSWYFDFDTYELDWDLIEKDNEEGINLIIEQRQK